MKQADDPRMKLEEIGSDVKEYAEIRIELAKLDLAEKTGKALASMIMIVMVAMFLSLFVAFITLAFAFWMSKLLGSYTQGFLLVSGVFLVIALLIRWSSPIWMPGLRDSFIKSFFDGNEN